LAEGFKILKAAAVQAAPIVLDKEQTLDKVDSLVDEALGQGAQLVVFPEAFLCCYPTSQLFGPVFGGFSDPAAAPAFRRFAAAAIDVPGPETDRLGHAAKRAGVWLCIGVNERTRTGTLHCTLLLFAPSGKLMQARRKLVPTHDERMVWGPGDPISPQAVETEWGRIGQLVCWENYMPLARFALYESGEQIHLAPTADASEGWQATIQHIALEGRVFVVASCQYLTRSDYPDDFELSTQLEQLPETLCRGGSAIIAPDGRYLVGPLHDETGVLMADLDLGEVASGKQLLDVAGHYHRPDAFRFGPVT
jgi:nitrilase